MCHRKASDGDEVRAMNPVLRKRAEQYLLSESVSHKEWRALVVEMLEDADKLIVQIPVEGANLDELLDAANQRNE